MYTVPKFIIHEDQHPTKGVFDWGPSRNELFDRYYDAEDLFYMGEVDRARKMLTDIISEDPHFIDAYNLLGNLEQEQGHADKARTHYQKAVEIGEQIIPSSFSGQIQWGFTENRPFLKALHNHAMDLFQRDKVSQSIQELEQLLEYNPHDNQGVRLIIADLHFLAGNRQQAESIYKRNLDYPPYRYSYGLLQFSRQNYARAAKFFRKGIISNIYISDLLRGKLPIIEYQIWHGSNDELPETAFYYVSIMSAKWMEFPEALDLLDFLHIADPSRSEIEQIYMLKQGLHYGESIFGGAGSDDLDMGPFDTKMDFAGSDMDFDMDTDSDYNMREELLGEIKEIEKQITDQSSRQLIQKWKDSSFSDRPDL